MQIHIVDPLSQKHIEANISHASNSVSVIYYCIRLCRNEWKQFHVVRGIWGQTQGHCYSGGSQTTLGSTSPRDPPNDLLSLSNTEWGGVRGSGYQVS